MPPLGAAATTRIENEWGPRGLSFPTRGHEALGPADARWILAARTREQLEGGRAAVLSPERRTTLNQLGRRLGLRPFDVTLVLAIVQDSARCGFVDRGELVSRLAMVPGPGERVNEQEESRAWWGAWIGGTLVLTALLVCAGAAWLSP